MEILVACALAYLLVSPDKMSLAFSRGVFGAARGGLTGRTPKTAKAAKPSPRGRAMLAGWREGVTAARERREAGRDLWARGSRVAGRAAGGGASLVRGINDTVRGRSAQTDDAGLDGSASPDAVPSRRGWNVPRLVRKPRTAPTSEASGAVVDEDGNDVKDSATSPDAAAGPSKDVPEPTTPRADEDALELARLREEAKRSGGILDALRGPLHSTAGDLTGNDMTDEEAEDQARKIAEGEGEEAEAARRLIKHLDAIRAKRDAANAEIAKREATPNTTPATPAPIRTAPIGVITMPNQSELSTVDELANEIKTMENVFTDLADAIAKAKKWGANLPDRWEAANWGTKGLDRGVMDLSEEIAGIKLVPLESFAGVRSEITKARTLGETADAIQAHGKTESFRPD